MALPMARMIVMDSQTVGMLVMDSHSVMMKEMFLPMVRKISYEFTYS